MKVVSLASGSAGNAYCVESDGYVLLIDCGLSCRELLKRSRAAGIDLGSVVAAVFTHSHDDHIKGVAKFHDCFPGAGLFANAMTADSIAACAGVDEMDFSIFENGQDFEAGPFDIKPFAIPHDTSDPVGFLVADGDCRYFHATDIGTPLESIGENLAEADIATLESNHDAVLLRKSGRHPSLIQRIAGPRGHLSNDQACDLVRRFASPRLRKLALAHLSRDCNVPHVAEDAMRTTLCEIGRTDIDLKVLCQDEIVEI